MQFKAVFIAVLVCSALVISALLLHKKRPATELHHPTAQAVRATGKCAQCHRRETSAIVHQFEGSRHAKKGVTCLSCHQAQKGQKVVVHRGFKIAKKVTSKNCALCHKTEHDQFMRSRHAAPAWAAVAGRKAFTKAQIAFAEKYHKGAVDRPANKLAQLEGPGAITKGCQGCHDIGKPNEDGSIGTCTQCHARHSTSVSLARMPQTCGQCHMGPDHSQLEIYKESKHGALFVAQKKRMRLHASPKKLTTKDMPVPTCATCHMSGLEGMKVTHDVTERLSWYLFAPVSKKRPGYERGRQEMMELCQKCHSSSHTKRFYREADVVLHATNRKIRAAQKLMAAARKEGLLAKKPFSQSLQYLYFDLWHYYGRTAKHAAYMGGADFVQWHGNYELLHVAVKMKEKLDGLRLKKRLKALLKQKQPGQQSPKGTKNKQASPSPRKSP